MYRHDYSASNTSTSGSSNLYDSTYYFLTSDYRVYKVLDNNDGAAYSGSEPTSESNDPFAIGGYVIKYMYTISTSNFAKYGTTDFISVATDSTVSAAATDGKIESLVVTGGSGYTDGTYYAAIYGDGTSQGTSSGAIVRITVTSGTIVSFGLTAGTDTTTSCWWCCIYIWLCKSWMLLIYSPTLVYHLHLVLLGSGTGGAISVIISPDGGHGSTVQ